MLKVVELSPTFHYTLSMKRGDRYLGLINGKRYWRATLCGHAVPMYLTKRCKHCWLSSDERRHSITKPRRYTISGEGHHSWKGGKIINTGGYVCARVNGKYELEHRIVMESYLGRKLRDGEEVHHINHNKQDNRIENLALFSNHAEHLKHEHKKGERTK